MKKIFSIVGARPNFMKIAPVHRAFKKYADTASHSIVHTGQHYDRIMSDAFFADLEMPEPKYLLGVGSGTHAEQTAKVMIELEKIIFADRPDMILVAGDVNSTMAAAITAVKCGVRTAHIEGGLRSFDREMPEEINRIVTDSICDYCFVTEQSAIDNLKNENYPPENIFFVGNTMIDSQKFALEKAEKSQILTKLGVEKGSYALVTLHRPSAVDVKKNLEEALRALAKISESLTVVFPAHPRTQKNIKKFGLADSVEIAPNLKIIEPVGYVDFLALTANCKFVLTDSGGIQEETAALGIPCITARTSTERPVTIECGTNRLVAPQPDSMIEAATDIIKNGISGSFVPKFWDGKAAERIAKIIIDKCI